MVAQRMAGVLGPEAAAGLKDWNNLLGEGPQLVREGRSHDREAVDRPGVLGGDDAVGELFRGAGELILGRLLVAFRMPLALMVTVQEVTEAVLAAMPACKVVARVGTGLDSIDLDEAARRGVQVTYVAGYSVDEVSTHAIALHDPRDGRADRDLIALGDQVRSQHAIGRALQVDG